MRALALLALLAAPALAEEGKFSAGSQAQSWGLTGEQPARFEARVVDTLCALTGDCPADCGGGARQLALLRTADDAIVPVLKNAQALFNGAVDDLLPYCGEMVEVDGNLVGDDPANDFKAYHLQFIRRQGEEAFSPATRWTEAWARRNPDAARLEGPWFRNDPRIRALIARDGYLGLGLEEDAAFKAYLFE